MASGDVVNTAARLQAAAPTNGHPRRRDDVPRDERAIEYEEPRPIEAKGKAEPIAVWEARRARARASASSASAALRSSAASRSSRSCAGRSRASLREREPQLVTLVGVPGIGKSRLVFELFQTIETGDYGLVYWRHGRSLPYGEGVTFWALGEMVKAQAGILESDRPEQAADEAPPGRRAGRLGRRRGAAGSSASSGRSPASRPTSASAGDRRDEAFAAWRRFLEAIARRAAARARLRGSALGRRRAARLRRLPRRLGERACRCSCSARPGPSCSPAGPAGAAARSTRRRSSSRRSRRRRPSRSCKRLLGRSAIDADVQARLLEHAGGQPAVRGGVHPHARRRVPTRSSLPETVQGIIAARLDTLPAEEKELLQDAAVIGRVFWLGALGRERWTLEERLHSLERKEFVDREPPKLGRGRGRVRLPPRARARRRLRADPASASGRTSIAPPREWIESLGRPEDHAEMLAHHYAAALEFARARRARRRTCSSRRVARARRRRSRVVASTRSTRPRASTSARSQLVGRPRARTRSCSSGRARSLHLAGRRSAGRGARGRARGAALEWAIARAGGRGGRASRRALLASRGTASESLVPSRAALRARRAIGPRRQQGAGPQPASRATACWRERTRRGHGDRRARRSRMAEALDLDELRAQALDRIGVARLDLGDARRGSTNSSAASRSPWSSARRRRARGYNNLGSRVGTRGDFARALAHVEEAIASGERLGEVNSTRFSRTFRVWLLFRSGAGTTRCRRQTSSSRRCEAGSPTTTSTHARCPRAFVLPSRDDEARRSRTPARPRAAGRDRPPEPRPRSLSGSARVLLGAGQLDEARAVARGVARARSRSRPLGFDACVASQTSFALRRGVARWLAPGTAHAWTGAADAVLVGDFERGRGLLDAIGTCRRGATRGCEPAKAPGRGGSSCRGRRAAPEGARLLPHGRARRATSAGREALAQRRPQRFPRSACSRSIASKSALKFPIPKPREPWRSMTSKKSVGRSWTIFVKSWSR